MSPLERTGRGSAEHTDRGRQINQVVGGMGTSNPAPNGAMGVSNLIVGTPTRHERGLDQPPSRPSSRVGGNGGSESGASHLSAHGTSSQLLFFDTFSHEVIEELNLDLVQVIQKLCYIIYVEQIKRKSTKSCITNISYIFSFHLQ